MKIRFFSSIFFLFIIFFAGGCLRDDDTNFDKGSVELNNIINENYKIVYEEMNGIPSHRMKVSIYRDGAVIFKEQCKYDKRFIPNQVLFLLSVDGFDYYYIGCEYSNNISNDEESRYSYANVVEFDSKTKYSKTLYFELDEHIEYMKNKICGNIDKDKIIDMFDICSYNSDIIVSLY